VDLNETLSAEHIIEIGQDTMEQRGISGEFQPYRGAHR
jgi:hypothetical protein